MSKQKTIYSEENKKLRDWLRLKKDEQEISIRELADKLNWSKAIVGKILTGDRRLDVVEYVAVCEALDSDVHEGIDVISSSHSNKKVGRKSRSSRER